MNFDCIDETRCGDEESTVLNGQTVGARIAAVLSKRQREILLAACLGKTDKTIADTLGVSPRTMEGHWRAIHRKLGSVNRCQAGFLFAILRESTQGKALA